MREPFEVAQDEDIVIAVAAAAAETDGREHPITGASYWADSAFISAAGVPTVVYGPSGEGAHELVEWVSISDTEAVARTLAGVASRICA